MATTVDAGEPGTIREIHYSRPRGVDGKYPVTYWGTVDEQVKEAQAGNREYMWSGTHKMMDLYGMECDHVNPDDSDEFVDVEDLLNAWMARNAPGLTWADRDLYWKNRKRGESAIPKYAAYALASNEYGDNHNGVCLLDPQGSCCIICSDGDDDGHESGACRLPENLRECENWLWWAVSHEGIEYRAKS